MSHSIHKVVIPAAGIGSRFLPATKAVPNEMMPIGNIPLIQFAVEEAAASGLESVILVLSRGKSLLAEHFHRNENLESVLVQHGRNEDAQLLSHLSQLAEVRVVWQEASLGLADAIRRAQPFLDDEPFAVICPDALIDSVVPCIRQLMTCYGRHPGHILATQVVEPSEADGFSFLEVIQMRDQCCDGRTLRVSSFIERPTVASETARYGIFGRFILQPEIFRALDQIRPALNGDLRLIDAMLSNPRGSVYAYSFEGLHYDASSKFGFLQATLAYALKDPDIARRLRKRFSALATSA